MKNTLSILLVLVLLLPLSVVTHAANGKNNSLKVSNASQAAKIVKQRTGGKVLKVKGNGKSGYKVKVMKKSGHIVSLKVDAKSGKIKGN